MLLRNPCKNVKSYDNPFWGKSREGPPSIRGKIPKIVVSLSCSAKPLVARNALGPKEFLVEKRGGGLSPAQFRLNIAVQSVYTCSGVCTVGYRYMTQAGLRFSTQSQQSFKQSALL